MAELGTGGYHFETIVGIYIYVCNAAAEAVFSIDISD